MIIEFSYGFGSCDYPFVPLLQAHPTCDVFCFVVALIVVVVTVIMVYGHGHGVMLSHGVITLLVQGCVWCREEAWWARTRYIHTHTNTSVAFLSMPFGSFLRPPS